MMVGIGGARRQAAFGTARVSPPLALIRYLARRLDALQGSRALRRRTGHPETRSLEPPKPAVMKNQPILEGRPIRPWQGSPCLTQIGNVARLIVDAETKVRKRSQDVVALVV